MYSLHLGRKWTTTTLHEHVGILLCAAVVPQAMQSGDSCSEIIVLETEKNRDSRWLYLSVVQGHTLFASRRWEL